MQKYTSTWTSSDYVQVNEACNKYNENLFIVQQPITIICMYGDYKYLLGRSF